MGVRRRVGHAAAAGRRAWAVAVAVALSVGPRAAAAAPDRPVPVQRPKNLRPRPTEANEAQAPPSEQAGETGEAQVPPAERPAVVPDGDGATAAPPRSDEPAAPAAATSEPPPPQVSSMDDRPFESPVASPTATDTTPAEAPRSRPRRFVRGTAPIVAGSVIAGSFLLFRDVLLITEVASVAGASGGDSLGPEGVVPIVTVPSQVLLFMAPAGLVAAGAYLRGRADALALPPGRLARPVLRQRARAGWAMFGLGVGLLAAEVGWLVAWVPGFIDGSRALTLAHVGLALSGTGFVAAGVAVGPYASGQLRGLRERERGGAGIVVVPQLSSTGGGIHVAGRW